MGVARLLLDLSGQNAMEGDVTDIVHVPLEAGQPIEHTVSIYLFCIYIQAARGSASTHKQRPQPPPGGKRK
jgi:hypothetical protein